MRSILNTIVIKRILSTGKQLIEIIKSRIKYGVSQGYIAKQLGVSTGYLSDVLNGKRGIGEKIPKALGYEIDYKRIK